MRTIRSTDSRTVTIATALAVTVAIAAIGCLTNRLANIPTSSAAGKTFRVLEWNVSDSDWVKQRMATRAVLRHADPDVLVFGAGRGWAAAV